MKNLEHRVLNGRQHCFGFDGLYGKNIKCKALTVNTVEECLKCNFYKTNVEFKSQQKTIADKLGLNFE